MISILRPIFSRTATDKYDWVPDTKLRKLLKKEWPEHRSDLFVDDLFRLYEGLDKYNKIVNSVHTVDIVLPRETDYMLRAENSLLKVPHHWLHIGLHSGRIMGMGGAVLDAHFITEPNPMVSFLHVQDDTLFHPKKSLEFLTNMHVGSFMGTLFSDTRSQLTNFNTDFKIA